MPEQPLERPYFSIVSAVYNVARYLDDFFAGLDAQSLDHQLTQVVLVDDGSTDNSLELLEAWAAKTDYQTVVLTKTNGGQSSARNLGLDSASGEWVTFPDPDDMLEPDYLEQIRGFLVDHEVCMAVANLWDYREASGELVNRHPLRTRFDGGNQVVDVDRFPTYFQLSISSAFVRLDKLNANSLRFEERVRPIFEDAHLIQRYLFRTNERLVGFVESTRYIYRRRADLSSTLQNSGSDVRRYTDVLEFGYLNLLRTAINELGKVPIWLQNIVIYELTWTLRSEEAMFGATAGIDGTTAARFHGLVEEIRSYLDFSVIEGFSLIKRNTSQREALLHGYKDRDWRWDSVVICRYDKDRSLVELRYHFTGKIPKETVRFRGLEVAPRHAKTRAFNYLRKTLVNERTLWMSSAGTLEIDLDGKPVPLTFEWPQSARYSVRPAEISSRKTRKPVASHGLRRAIPLTVSLDKSATSRSTSRLRGYAENKYVRRLFRDAWVLMDRDYTAGDNAEHLFRYLRKRRRDVNAWYVIRKDTEDYRRLRAEGYKRVVPYGSLLWKLLCLNAKFIVSSHADGFVYDPAELRRVGRPTWKFIFLQHGVTKDDLSRWLNSKPIVLMITATKAEYASVAGDNSPYLLSPREVVRTGFPRHDRLIELAGHVKQRRTITIMPTWRQNLVGERIGTAGERAPMENFLDTQFARLWLGLLTSDRLKSIAKLHNLTIEFMPHPNLRPYLEQLGLPEHIQVTTYDQGDVQQVISSSALVVTDYSSIAFDAAIIRRPVSYFQFDAHEVFGGAHPTRPGYFRYREDGFGPVAGTIDGALDDIAECLEQGPGPAPEYLRRIHQTFGKIKPGASERVVSAIEKLETPLSPRQARKAVSTPLAPAASYPN